MEEQAIRCLHCGSNMNYMGTERFQLGQAGAIFRDLPHILAGAIELSIYLCPKCGKVEFFAPPGVLKEEPQPETPQIVCPQCGRTHDFDYPKCPFCGFDQFTPVLPSHDEASSLPQVRCPSCGAIHDFDCPKCPVCKYDYTAE